MAIESNNISSYGLDSGGWYQQETAGEYYSTEIIGHGVDYPTTTSLASINYPVSFHYGFGTFEVPQNAEIIKLYCDVSVCEFWNTSYSGQYTCVLRNGETSISNVEIISGSTATYTQSVHRVAAATIPSVSDINSGNVNLQISLVRSYAGRVHGITLCVEYLSDHGIFNLILPGKANYPEPVSPTQEYTISKYPASYTTSGSISGTKYRNAIGKGADTAAVSGNDYASSSGTYAYINYAFDFSEIPDNAVIKSMSVSVKGHRESTSQGTAALEVYHTGTNHDYSAVANFTSTSQEVLKMNIKELPTRQDLRQMALKFTIGYYGGLVNGATWTVTYEA